MGIEEPFYRSIILYVEDRDKLKKRNDEEKIVSKKYLVRLLNELYSKANKKWC